MKSVKAVENEYVVHTKPVVDPQIWDEVPHSQIGPTVLATNGVESRSDDEQTEI